MAKKKNIKTKASRKKSKKSEGKTDTYRKCVKQFSLTIPQKAFDCLMADAREYQNCRNYAYSRCSGINSLPRLRHHRQLIRDVWMKTDKERADQSEYIPVISWKLPARLWKLALDDAAGGLKSAHANTVNRVRDIVRKHDFLTEEEKHFCYWILCSDIRLHHCLKRHAQDYSQEIWDLPVDRRNLQNKIRRWYRSRQNAVPYSKNHTSYSIDSGMYRYKVNEKTKKACIYISTFQTKGEKIPVLLKDGNIYKGNLQILLHPETRTLEIHTVIKARKKNRSKEEKKSVFTACVGADKGMTEMLHLSSGHAYGRGLGAMIVKESDFLKDVWQKRNPIDAKVRLLREQEQFKEAARIEKKHLGRKKLDRHQKAFESSLKTFINKEIRRMFLTEHLKELVLEDLTWLSHTKRPREMNRRLHAWVKGYIQERLEYYAQIYGVKITMINPAYTSKFCHECGSEGVRKGKKFYCPHCGKEMDADYNAACNIKARKEDPNITLYTSAENVKPILQSRFQSIRNNTLPSFSGSLLSA